MFEITNKNFKGKKDKLKQNKVSKINKAQGLVFTNYICYVLLVIALSNGRIKDRPGEVAELVKCLHDNMNSDPQNSM